MFVHLNKHPEQYVTIFFGFGGSNYCNTCHEGGIWATLSYACLEALEETVSLAWFFFFFFISTACEKSQFESVCVQQVLCPS